MIWLFSLFTNEIYHVSCLISIFAEFFCGEIRSLDGEEGVLIQAIISIKSIINIAPSSYEKVLFLQNHLPQHCYSFFIIILS